MPAPYTTIGPWTLPTFTFALGLAILVSLVIGLRRAAVHGETLLHSYRAGAAADAYLGALAGGILLARLGHVILAWDYFRDSPGEILHLELGGVNWHGAVIGGLIGLAVVARLRARFGYPPPPIRHLLDALTPGLPLIGLAGWWGCWAAACGYGLEVPTLAGLPPLIASESADIFGIVAPRYNTQIFGLLVSGLALLLAALLLRRRWLRGLRFWLLLLLLSLGMFAIGFYRGDAVALVGGLRLDQWFDLALLMVGAAGLVSEVMIRARIRYDANL